MRTLTVACVLLYAWPALGHGQSLGSAAQKEKERRKKNQESGVKARVVGDEEMAAVRQDAPPSPSPSPAAAKSESPAPAAESDSADEVRTQQEAQWRARMAQASDRLEQARKTYERLSQMHLAPGEYFADDKGRAVVWSAEQLQRLTARAKTDLEAAQAAMERLEEDARRAGIPPGWLR